MHMIPTTNRKRFLRPIGSALVAIFLSWGLSASAQNWPNWRGPNFDGSTTASNLPDTWTVNSDRTGGENIAWVTDLPGSGSGTPIVWGDRVFISSMANNDTEYVGLCVDLYTGKVLWKKTLGLTEKELPNNDMCSPSATTDGKMVCFSFGSGATVGVSMDGDILWRRHLEKEYSTLTFQFGYSSSPMMIDGKIYIVVLRGTDFYRHTPKVPVEQVYPFILCLDPQTGENVWMQKRLLPSVGESFESYVSAIPVLTNEGQRLLVYGGDHLTAHRLDTGAEIWRYCYNPTHEDKWRLIASVGVGEGLVLAGAPRGQWLFAMDANQNGFLTEDAVKWRLDDRNLTPDVCTPLYYRGRFYALEGDRKTMTCLDPQSGRIIWSEKIGGPAIFRASPVAADDKIYFIGMKGEAVVMAAGDKATVLDRIEMGGQGVEASVAIANEGLLIRTSDRLFRIKK